VVAKHRKPLTDVVAPITGTATAATEERFEHPVASAAMLGLAAGAGRVCELRSGLGYILLAMLGRVGAGRRVRGVRPRAAPRRSGRLGREPVRCRSHAGARGSRVALHLRAGHARDNLNAAEDDVDRRRWLFAHEAANQSESGRLMLDQLQRKAREAPPT